MKIIPFTIPVAKESCVIVQEDVAPHFYNHLHRHNEIQITWIIKGEGTLIAGNYMQPFKANDVYVLGANQPHIFKSDPAYFAKRQRKQVHALSLFFNPYGLFRSILDLPEARTIRKWVDATRHGLHLRYPLYIITREMLAVKQAKQAFRLSTFIQLLQVMANIPHWKKLSTVSSEYPISDTEGLRMNNVYQFTMAHYLENISLQQVANIACMTTPAFCRYFKKHTGKTYIGFLNEIRISEASKKLVTHPAENITAIAYASGFSNAVSFNRVFRKITGKSPTQYRKEYRVKTEE
jgi:AraC-like DNA-binding protein